MTPLLRLRTASAPLLLAILVTLGGCPTSAPTALCGNGQLDAGEQCDDGNSIGGDGCEVGCTATVVGEVQCRALAPLPSGSCSVTAGDAGRVILGTVLTPEAVYRGGQLVVDSAGSIVQVGCPAECDSDPACASVAATATTVTCPTAVISPGLINAHDHLTYTQNDPVLDSGERYENRHEWRLGRDGHTRINVAASATSDELAWGELRQLLGGATSLLGSGSAAGLLRNLDNAARLEGLAGHAVATIDGFPLGDSTPPAGYPSPVACSAFTGAITEAELASLEPLAAHVAEGIDGWATNEFVCLSEGNPGHDLVAPRSAFTNAIGLGVDQLGAMARAGTALVWSPRSNLRLYGVTSPVVEADRLGIRIAIGTDWLPTGSMNVLRELRCADAYNRAQLAGHFDDRALWLMATANAAAVTGFDDALGTLAPGKVADVAVFDGSVHSGFRAVLDAAPQDVLLVLRAGKALYGDAALVDDLSSPGACDALDVCGRPKSVCLAGEVGRPLAGLQAVLPGIYPAFFCGEPAEEPTCTPARQASVSGSTVYTGVPAAGDLDGDGIADGADDCPTVFNPVRPMDGGAQADFDGDGDGDACDPCPLDAGTSSCSFDPNDVDGDGAPNTSDVCPSVSDPAQLDSDADGLGDACDACPSPNPGGAACPVTIYQLKEGTIPLGSVVSLTGQLVTARNATGYFLQVKPGDPDWDAARGADFSGLFVYDPGNSVASGDRVSVAHATLDVFFDETMLTSPLVTVVSSAGEVPPAPVLALPAEVATGGARAAALEGVIVRVEGVSVTDVAPPLGAGDVAPSREFVVSGALRVNDFLYLASPFPVLGEPFVSLTGVLEHRSGDSKLEPRGAADVVRGSPVLAAFGPALSYVDEGQVAAASFPEPLTVTLSHAPASDTFVAIDSSDPTSLTVVGGGVTVPAGLASATVLLDGVTQAASVRLTATLGGSMVADVRVVGAAEAPLVASLTPAVAGLPTGGTLTLTVALDLPAPAGGATVTLDVTPADAGTLPATVTVPAGQLGATFVYADAGTQAAATVTATLGASSAFAALTLAAAPDHLVISEVRTRGPAGTGASDEFVELYNPTDAPVVLDPTWTLEARSNISSAYSLRWTGAGAVIPAHGHFLVAGSGYVQTPARDAALTSGFTDAVSLRLVQATAVVDALCLGFDAVSTAAFADASYGCEGTPIAFNPHDNTSATNADASLERKPGGAAGSTQDTGDNAADFLVAVPASPENLASPPVP